MSLREEGENTYTITRKNMCDIFFESKFKSMDNKFQDLLNFLIKETNCPNDLVPELKNTLRNFKQQFTLKWAKCNRHRLTLENTEKTWLNKLCVFKQHQQRVIKGGRPRKDFNDSSDQTKRRKTAEMRDSYSAEELMYAAQMKLRASGNLSKAGQVKEITNSNELPEENLSQHKVTPTQAVSLIIEAQLSKKQYNLIRDYAKDVFPSYKMVKKEKAASYPKAVTYTESQAEVPLQSLLDHTASRLLCVQKEVMTTLKSENKFILDVKWGFDGSSSHTQYMQKFASENTGDKYMFLASLVPIRLTMKAEDESTTVIWKNPRPSSPRYCRPIKLQYQKETTELSKTLKADIDNQINNLVATKVLLQDKEYSVTHNLVFTMVDGKICNALSDTKSTMKCYLCGATSKGFNDLENIMKMPINKDYLSFGISVLHSWIRLFESLLHIAYKIPVQTWRVPKEKKAEVEVRKSEIQKKFFESLSLIVDKPKPGFGNTNDGNVARKFFQNHEISAEITGIDNELIRRFYIILQVMSSGFKIDPEKFKNFCTDTAKLYISLYPWCPMTTTVHKILIHGADIISEFLLPIGCLSEEAQEARNRDFKIYRERFSRKSTREKNMEDVFNRLLVSSDPVITQTRSLPVLERKMFYPETINMFIPE